jgi:5-methylthioadenosine/S-adenosylhomocysteine deaminase
MACHGGAEVFGQPQEIGSLEPGKKADIVLVDLNTPFAVPVHSVPSALVYNLHGSNVDTVIIDGKVVMRQKKIIVLDELTLLRECSQAAKNLMNRLG